MTALEVLDETERLIRVHGWTRGREGDCILNRMFEVCGLRFGSSSEKNHVGLHGAANALRQFVGHHYLTRWNDAHARTIDDVLAAIDGARKALKPS